MVTSCRSAWYHEGWRPPHLSIWIGNGIFVQLSQDSKKHLAFDRVAVVHLDSVTFLWQQITVVASEIPMANLCSKSLNSAKFQRASQMNSIFVPPKNIFKKNNKHDLGGFQTLFWGVLDLKWHLMFEGRNFKQNSTKKTPEKPRETSTNSSCVRCVWVLKFMTVGPQNQIAEVTVGTVFDSRKPNVHWRTTNLRYVLAY